MTPDDKFIGSLEAYLDEYEGMTPLPDPVRDAVRAQLPMTKQLGRFSGPMRRFPLMNNNFVRVALVAAALVVVVIIGANLLPRPSVGPSPSVEPSLSAAPSATAASPKALPTDAQFPLTPGTYALGEDFPVGVTFDVPTGWVACSLSQLEQSVCQKVGGAFTGIGVSFTIIDNVVADPCGSPSALLDPPVGPSVDDLVTAISNLQGFEATAATDVTVDGFDGKLFTVTAPSSPACSDMKTWATADRTNGMGADEVTEMRILDVGGVRLVIVGTHGPTSSAEQLSTIQQIIASVHIEP